MAKNIFKGLFASASPKVDEREQQKTSIHLVQAKESYQDMGFRQAGRLGGTISGLRVCLQRIHHDHRQEARSDQDRQKKLMRPYRDELNGHEHDAVRQLAEEAKIREERIPELRQRIEEKRKEISAIRQDPSLVIGEDTGKAGFIIGLVILVFLTIYLFLFYSSATYSAFFKEFTISNIGVARSIFDPQAIRNALAEGPGELGLILTIPFVFLGLGYLIHKMQQSAGWTKYPRIGLLILVTFVFDGLLAFEITQGIYNVKQAGSFIAMPDYTVSMAMHNVQFWMVIFAGFVVYIIWGLVFDIVMESYTKLDSVAVAIRERRRKVMEIEGVIEKSDAYRAELLAQVAKHRKESNRLKEFLEQGFIISQDFEQYVFQFAQGWMAYMKGSGMSTLEMNQTNSEVHDFVKIVCGGPNLTNTSEQ